MHMDELVKKLRVSVGFFYKNKSCFTLNNRKQIIESTFFSPSHWLDTIYMHASASVLKPQCSSLYSPIRFITGDGLHFARK